jgi:hypothetical protein
VAHGAPASRANVAAGDVAKSASVAAVNASRLLSQDKVSARVAELRAAQSIAVLERLEISREEIARKYLTIVQADPNDLVGVKVSACRCCHGEGHEHQWGSEAEHQDAFGAWLKKREPLPRPNQIARSKPLTLLPDAGAGALT